MDFGFPPGRREGPASDVCFDLCRLGQAVSSRSLQKAGAVGIGVRRSLRCGPCLHGVALVGSLATLVAGRLSRNRGCTLNVLNSARLTYTVPQDGLGSDGGSRVCVAVEHGHRVRRRVQGPGGHTILTIRTPLRRPDPLIFAAVLTHALLPAVILVNTVLMLCIVILTFLLRRLAISSSTIALSIFGDLISASRSLRNVSHTTE
jgi:hypothetical protein